jgi:hypothetical protein
VRRIVLSFLLLATFGVGLASAASRVGNELRINVNDTPRQRYPVAALDGQGGALVVWTNTRLGILGRQVSLDNPGAGGAEMMLLANTNLPSIPGEGYVLAHKEPALLYEEDGSFWVVWTRERSYLKSVPFHDNRTLVSQDIRARRFDAQGQALGPVVLVGAAGPGFQSKPAVVRTSEGAIAVAWQSVDGDNNSTQGDGIYLRFLSAAGHPAGPVHRVSQGTAELAAANVALAADDNGRVLVVWDGSDGSSSGVFRRLYSAEGAALGDAQRVNTATAGRQAHPSAAYLPGSGYLVLWHGATGERFRTRVYGQRLDADGQRLGGEIEVSHGALEYEYDPAVVATPRGTFMAVWMLWDTSFPRALRGHELAADGSPIGIEININTFRMGAQYRSALAVHPDDGVFAVWEGYWNKKAGISGQRIGLE